MKKLIFRKILSDFLIFFILTIFSLSLIIWVFQAVNYLDIMINDGRNYLVYLKYSILNYPKIISKIIPFGILISFFYTLTKYEDNNELIIFWNIGIEKIKFINFFLKFSIVLVFFQILMTAFIIPYSQDLARSQLRTSSVNYVDSFIKEKKFNDIIKDVTIYSEAINNNNELENIYIKKKISNNKYEITYAKRGLFKNLEKSQYLILHDGENLSMQNENLTNIKFEKFQLNLDNLETNTVTYKKTQENLTTDLFKCLINLGYYKQIYSETLLENCGEKNLSNIYRELYKRIIIPLYIPIMVLIPLLLILKSKENIKFYKSKILIFVLGIAMIVFSETTLRYVYFLKLNIIISILMPLLILSSLYLYFYFKLQHKK